MTEDDIEEYQFVLRAKREMSEKGTDWVAFRTNYDAKKNLSLCKNIAAWYSMSATPCTDVAIEKSGGLLNNEEWRECIPRPDSTAGIIIAIPKHPIMEAYLMGWNVSDTKRLKTRRSEILKYVEYQVISADQASAILGYDE